MTQSKIYPVLNTSAMNAHIGAETYQLMHELSINDPERFWEVRAEEFIDWDQHWDSVSDCDLSEARVNWFAEAKLNACYNCLDRHLKSKAHDPAIIWEGDDPRVDKKISYQELYEEVCRFANALKNLAVAKGDCVCINMPMIPEAVVVMLACTRIGAIHTVASSELTTDQLQQQIEDASCRVVVTADEGIQGGQRISLKENVDQACHELDCVQHVVVVKAAMKDVNWQQGRDHWYHDIVTAATVECPVELMDANDPLFIVYTPSSSEKPKGIVHTTGGYLVYCAVTFKYIFDYHDGDVHWCTAGLGNVVGHSYVVYGPLANGARVVLYEGEPTYPDASRFWQIIEKHQVNIFYTDTSTLNVLQTLGEEVVSGTDRSSLRILATGGRAMDVDVWEWFYHVVGEARCPILNAWWQAESGGILLSPMPGVTDLKPGSVASPFFGISPALADEQGNELEGEAEGDLVFKQSWPGQMKTVYKNEVYFQQNYFKQGLDFYFSGDRARRDGDGDYWILV